MGGHQLPSDMIFVDLSFHSHQEQQVSTLFTYAILYAGGPHYSYMPH